MDLTYAAGYADLYRRHWWWRAREAYVLRWIARLAPAGGWDAVLDVGCGDGVAFPVLERFGRVEGVEPEAAVVSNAMRDRIHVGPFDDSFRPGRQYGLIVMLDVLEHGDDPVGMLRHARELLAPGGVVVITVPAHRWLWTAHDDLNQHRTRYTRATLEDVAATAGLRLAATQYFFHWLVPAKLLVRALERVRGARPGPPRVPPAPLNAALRGLSLVEQRLVTPLRPPAGSSLLAVARPA